MLFAFQATPNEGQELRPLLKTQTCIFRSVMRPYVYTPADAGLDPQGHSRSGHPGRAKSGERRTVGRHDLDPEQPNN